jgi:hypothetical protein
MGRSIEDYMREAKAAEQEAKKLGISTYEQILRHRERKRLLGDDYQSRDTGTWRQAEEFMRRERERCARCRLAVRTLRLSCRKAGKAPIFTPVRESSGESS